MDIEHSKLVLDDFAQETSQTASKIKKKWIGYIIFRNRVMATLGIIKTIGIHPKLSNQTKYVEGIEMIVQWHDQHDGNKTKQHRQTILDIARWATLKLAEKKGCHQVFLRPFHIHSTKISYCRKIIQLQASCLLHTSLQFCATKLQARMTVGQSSR